MSHELLQATNGGSLAPEAARQHKNNMHSSKSRALIHVYVHVYVRLRAKTRAVTFHHVKPSALRCLNLNMIRVLTFLAAGVQLEISNSNHMVLFLLLDSQ